MALETSTANYPKILKGVPYLPPSVCTTLNTIDICIPRDPATNENEAVWIVFIHGGAWRDPYNDKAELSPACDLLLKNANYLPRIAGFASMDYRLSPYPTRPSRPSTPTDPSRNSHHPDHINDCVAALAFLHKKYSFGEKYILAGHSVGANLVGQIITRLPGSDAENATFPLPCAIIGVEGIYDVPLMIANCGDEARPFVQNALGLDEQVWKQVSPTSYRLSGWHGKVAVVAQSKEDQLVFMDQAERGMEWLEQNKWEERKDMLLELTGNHDGVWEGATELARAFEVVLDLLAS